MLKKLASLYFTLLILIFFLILTFIGTIRQVDLGNFAARKIFFNSFFLYKNGIPYFPGAALLALFFVVNLIAACFVRFRFCKKQIGLIAIHFGLILLIVGEMATSFLSIESQMTIEEGEYKNYSESIYEKELVVIDTTNPSFDEVKSINVNQLKENEKIDFGNLQLVFRKIYPNAKLLSFSSPDREFKTLKGVGKKVTVYPKPPSNEDGEIDFVTAYVDIFSNENLIGTYLLSNGLKQLQKISFDEKTYQIGIRRKRYYFPFTFRLKKFLRENYPQTSIPKSFTSIIDIYTEDGDDDHQVAITMNHPLTFNGVTFYQAGFTNFDTVSILHVVQNPIWISPYLSCLMIAFGLLMQIIVVFAYRKKR